MTILIVGDTLVKVPMWIALVWIAVFGISFIAIMFKD